ncbi:MAG: DNA repair protein RecN [Chloroflexota bacterium]|nr:DNA repair protein RecN [Chloroflexota bacterium]
MLEQIRIQNFAIIDQLDLTFAPGLNVITGETGAGKSIIIDAVDLLLGGKADAAFVRAGTDKSTIEGVFVLDARATAALATVLRRADLLAEDAPAPDTMTLTREVRANGRSTARVNGTNVNLDVLSDVGGALVDIHGQSEHLSLLKPSSHIELLDRFGSLLEFRSALGAVVNKLVDVRREIQRLTTDDAARARRAEMLRYAVEEIDAAGLVSGEDDELRAERSRLTNSEQLAEVSGEIMTLLRGEDAAEGFVPAVDALMQVAALLRKLAQIDAALKEDYDLAETVAAQAEELASNIRDYADTVEYNPSRLNEVEERLEAINSLKKRFGSSIDAILKYADDARVELDTLDHSEARLEDLRAQEDKLLHYVGDMAAKISAMRAAASKRMGAGVVTELADLRMGSARFEVDLAQIDDPDGCFVGQGDDERRVAFDHTGIDRAEFMMSANPGIPLRPLAKVASGGEAARIMLALKRVLSQADHTPTLIFDEIDTGIGGRVGSVVGEKLWQLTDEHQVLVVTHLAQLAGYADRHYRVEKLIENDANGSRTRTRIVPLDADHERATELAAMLGTPNESGYQSAVDLLLTAAHYKRGGESVTQDADHAAAEDVVEPEQRNLF